MAPSDTITIGGDLTVHRLGFGSMRLTGRGIWGPPDDPDECRAVLRRAVGLGVDLIDTADAYGPHVAEDLIGEMIGPHDGVVIATKAGLTRSGPDAWAPVGRPEYLRQECEMSLRRLRRDVIDLFQLHRIDPAVARDDQFGLLKALQDEGKIRHVGLSQVSVEEIEAARQIVEVATVQNRYNLAEQTDADVLEYCAAEGIGFMPWAPLGQGQLTGPGSPVEKAAAAHDVTPGAVALAWLLHRSPVMIPIPGTSRVDHLVDNMAAASLVLTDDERSAIDATVAA